MNRTASFVSGAFLLSGVTFAQVSFEWQLVGDMGNPGDAFNQFGITLTPFSMAKHEVTNAQYAVFLNAKATQGTSFGLFNPDMELDPRGGITRTGSGTPGDPYSFTAKPDWADKPVNFVTFFDAARFVNWMHNGQGVGDTETGAYELLGAFPTAIERSAGARFFLPDEDEWYKAGYYNPGGSPSYTKYATQSGFLPTAALATATGDVSNPGPQVANYGNFAVWGGCVGNPVTVGSAGSLSAYGCADMAGNALEWTETIFEFSGINNRIVRGGSWIDVGQVMGKDVRVAFGPFSDPSWLGFRVARQEGNPAQSLTLVAGAPSIGTTVTLGIDNAAATQAVGSLPFLAVSTAPDPAAPHGALIPGFSMLGAGQVGELLIAVAPPNPVLTVAGPPWAGPGQPAPVAVAIPNDPGLIGTTAHTQGLVFDASATFGVTFGLTNGLDLVLQP